MKKSELDQLMMSLGIAPNRKLGQNFLIDDNFLDALIRLADVKPGDRIIEVGPGFGALTSRLLKTGASVAAIEFDRKLAAWLRMTYANRGLCLIEGDACRVDIASIYGIDTPFRLISNLPYSAGTVIVANMLTLKTPPSEMFIMLQKEVAEAVGYDKSIVSRVVRDKAVRVATSRKLLPLADFFTHALAAGGEEAVSDQQAKGALRALVEAEDPARPLSDQALAEALSARGIPVARRTVAKYREQLGIASTRERRRAATT